MKKKYFYLYSLPLKLWLCYKFIFLRSNTGFNFSRFVRLCLARTSIPMRVLLLGYLSINTCWAHEREIAITIDDLPFVGSCNGDPKKLQREKDRFEKILQVLKEQNVPATGFIVANSIERGQWQLLESFKQAGFTLGNHTYSHQSLDALTAEKYINDVDKADKILTNLFGEDKYFRYPYLAEGRGAKRQQVHNYLAQHNYKIAPVTIDSKDYRFNQQLYSIPYRLRERSLANLRQKYLNYIWKQTLLVENVSNNNPNLPSKQILLIHANLLNSHFLNDVINMYKKNDYKFVTLNEILNNKNTNENKPINKSNNNLKNTAANNI